MAPGQRSLAFAARWFDPAIVHRTFEPLIADWQREWQDAAPGQRAWVSVRGWCAFVCAVMVSSPEVLRTSVPSAVTNRIARRIALFVGVASTLLLSPYVTQNTFDAQRPWLLLLLIPSSMTVAFPFAMAAAVDAIRRYGPLPPHVERAVVLKLGLFAVAFMVLFGGWVGPAANQAWRSHLSDSHPAPGVRELTSFALITDPSRAAEHEPYTGGADRVTRIQRELNNRATLIALPVLLLWLRWRALQLPNTGWVAAVPIVVAVGVTVPAFFAFHFWGWRLEHEWHLSPGMGYWVPIVMLTFWGLAAPRWRRLVIIYAHESPADIR